MPDFDAIVVGSGAGGLAAGLKIARHGHSVLLLEAAPELGGCLSPLEISGYTFHLGVHYLGELAEGGKFRQSLDDLGLTDRIELVELDPEAIDRYVFPDFELRLCKGEERFMEELIDLFPAEERWIRRYFEILDSVVLASEDLLDMELGAMSLLAWLVRHPVMVKYGRAPYQALLDSVTENIRLQTALAACWFDYMLPPARASASYGVGTWNHYLSGGFYPLGGSAALRDAFVDSLREHDAQLETSARVTAIDRRGEELVVSFAKGEEATAAVVVSDVDPVVTLGTLVDPELASFKVLRKAKHLSPSASVFGLLIGTDLDLEACGLTNGNLVHYNGYDVNEIFARSTDSRAPAVADCFLINSPSVRDPGGNVTPTGLHSLEVLSAASYEAFEPWAKLAPEERGEDYEDFVASLQEQMLTTAETYLPGLSRHLHFVQPLTPLDLERRLNLVRGGIYGPELTPTQLGPGRFANATCGIDGLFLAGAGTKGGSVRYCVTSGIQAGEKALAALP
jgi:all-trans-retinol 13,14-reductase